MALGRPRRLARIVRSAPGSGFGIFLVLFVPVASNAVEIWENNRFRFEVEPLHIVLTLWLVCAMTGTFSAEHPEVGRTPPG